MQLRVPSGDRTWNVAWRQVVTGLQSQSTGTTAGPGLEPRTNASGRYPDGESELADPGSRRDQTGRPCPAPTIQTPTAWPGRMAGTATDTDCLRGRIGHGAADPGSHEGLLQRNRRPTGWTWSCSSLWMPRRILPVGLSDYRSREAGRVGSHGCGRSCRFRRAISMARWS